MTDWVYDHAAETPPNQIPGFFVPTEGYCMFSRVMTDNGRYGTRMTRPSALGYDTGGIAIPTSGTVDAQTIWITGEARTNKQTLLGGLFNTQGTHEWILVADGQWHRFLTNCRVFGDDGDAQLWANLVGGSSYHTGSDQYVEFRGVASSTDQPPLKVIRIWAKDSAGQERWLTGLKIWDSGDQRWRDRAKVWDGSTLIDVI